ncbi:conserved protein of unknown function, containing transcription regulator LuxR, C-terminal [Magnetospirillum gryphiswaldense MSR-1 v2]|uniref:HTH luxR-type domain-containing protein n=1 Tax=Magnetospirillum gryphiswaldense (strain DSM 6361 / JCM 21280 / NBRC 15271 / MSR-1) TaxID=431944 RepID=V6F8T8_MAGGM|nr:helix-turn-helix transcriptional regulator [Magnetospirillum gryphiswaldense]CDL01238.1 conserved protein of unknown function, containing transcription regulator LuxR, C-terminal [Magnetospirillum gryphiswaldense MSR-1 v2]
MVGELDTMPDLAVPALLLERLQGTVRGLGFSDFCLRIRAQNGHWHSLGTWTAAVSRHLFQESEVAPRSIAPALIQASPLPAWWGSAAATLPRPDLDAMDLIRIQGWSDVMGMVFLDAGGPIMGLHLSCPEIRDHSSNDIVALRQGAEAILLHCLEAGLIGRPTERIAPMSNREHQVLTLLVRGYSNTDIAKTLDTTVNTTEFHLKNIYAKLGVFNRVGAALKATRLGLIIQE